MRLKFTLSTSSARDERLKRVMSKNSLMSSSSRSALSSATPVKRARDSGERSGSSRRSVRYPMTLVSGVFRSCAR